MQLTQKQNNSQWIAHDEDTTDVISCTLRGSLLQCQRTYLQTHFMTLVQKLSHDEFVKLISEPIPDDPQEYVDTFSHLIPCNIKFIIVTLQPRWETEVMA